MPQRRGTILGGQKSSARKRLVGNHAIAPTPDVCERGGGHDAFVAQKHDHDAGHWLFGVHGFPVTLGENMLRECELALAEDRAGNGTVGLSEYEKRLLPF